jgi:hypothetical protein
VEASLHQFATLRTGKMQTVRACRLHKLTDLRKALLGQPAFTASALNRHAIGFHFIAADCLMRAFVAEYPKLHRRGEANEKIWIEHDEAWGRQAEIVDADVENCCSGAARDEPAVDLSFAGWDKRAAALGRVGLGTKVCLVGTKRLRSAWNREGDCYYRHGKGVQPQNPHDLFFHRL